MPMAKGARGLPPGEALWCLLRLKGHEGSLAAFREAHAPGGTAEAMASPLEQHGLQARTARLQREDLPYLHLPTLARHRDGSWLVLRERTRKGWTILGSEGPETLETGRLWEQLDGQVLDLSPGLPRSGNLWARLRLLMTSFRPVLAMVVAATVLIQLLGLITPALTAVVVNRALPDGAGSLLGLVAAGIVLMALGHAWIDYVRGCALLYFTQRMDLAAERGLLEHILSLPFPDLRLRPVGEWLQAFEGFAAARDLLAEKTLGVFLDGTLALVLLAAMAFLLPGPAAVVAGATLVMVAATVLAGRAQARLQALEVEVQVKEQGYLAEVLRGVATLKAAGTEGQALRRWRTLFRKGLALGLRRSRLALRTGTGVALLGQGVDAGLLVWGGLQVVRDQLGLGAFLAFLQLASAFNAALLGLAEIYLKLLVLGPQLAKASALLELPKPDAPGSLPPSAQPEAIAMKDVWFRYRSDGPWVLGGFNLELGPGGKATLDYPSGWGKSTILRLLSGLETPERGQVLIGGLPPGQARHKLLYLPQFVQLFGGSIHENLTVLSGGAPREALLRAAALTGLDTFIATLPMGYRTILPHGGGTLSGGQRQWVALTAAVASARGVLILDEPLANLDPIVAAGLQAVLESGAWTLVRAGHGSGR